MSTILVAMDQLQIQLRNPNLDIHRQLIQTSSYERSQELPIDIARDIESLWGDEGVKECVSRASEYQLPVSAQ